MKTIYSVLLIIIVLCSVPLFGMLGIQKLIYGYSELDCIFAKQKVDSNGICYIEINEHFTVRYSEREGEYRLYKDEKITKSYTYDTVITGKYDLCSYIMWRYSEVEEPKIEIHYKLERK